jgi:long-chain fatty acid transport protein
VPTLTLLVASLAHAGGYYYPDSGIVPMGRAGAWVASADTQYAQYYNPAGLVNVEHPMFNVGLSLVAQPVSFTPLDDEGTEGQTVKNVAAPYPVPEFGFAMPIGEKFGFAFGFTSPYAPGYAYDPDGPQRYTLIDSLIWNFQLGPSLAYRATKRLSFGLGLQWQVMRIGYTIKVTTSGVADPRGDVLVDFEVIDFMSPGFNVGALYDVPGDLFHVGLCVQPPVSFVAKGKGSLDFTGNALGEHLDALTWADDTLTLRMTLPWVARAGVSVTPSDRAEAELAFVYEAWKPVKSLSAGDIDVTITGDAFVGEQALPETIALPTGFHDAWSVRLGGEVVAVPDTLAFRGGAFYEYGALSKDRVSVALVDIEKLGLAAGTTAQLGGFRVDLSGSYLFLPTQTLTDSRVTQIRVYPEGNDDGADVGNGILRSSGWVAALQLGWVFGLDKEG